LRATYKKYILNFKRPSGTSRGILKTKETWFIKLQEGGNIGYGECGILRTLSIDDIPEYEEKLKWTCENIHLGLVVLYQELMRFPSIQFGLEQAFLSLKSNDKFKLFPSKFTDNNKGITINGLVWMGEKSFMKQQISDKIKAGFTCIKMKIGAIDFETEMELLKSIRKEYSQKDIELRVDANGAFHPDEALDKLKILSDLNLHSIEQPIAVKQFEQMAMLCEQSPLAIALDEELIGVFNSEEKVSILQTIQPQYIILKPSLIGGFKGSLEWIALAEKQNIKYWVTSALESNIGLNAISQFTHTLNTTMPQGLGTGGLYTNNIESPLEIKNGKLQYNNAKCWELNQNIKFSS